jgi:DNA-binding response OmpR family regulator
LKTNFEIVPLADVASKGLEPVVLVVDDERLIADTLAAILMQNGFVATAAYGGEEGLKIAQAVPPDLLLTDVSMPGMDGIKLAIAVRQAAPECKVLLFSGHASTADLLARARDAGYEFTVLQKPLHPKELLAHISGALKSSDRGNGKQQPVLQCG